MRNSLQIDSRGETNRNIGIDDSRGVSFEGVTSITIRGVDNSFNKDVYTSEGGRTSRGYLLIISRGVDRKEERISYINYIASLLAY